MPAVLGGGVMHIPALLMLSALGMALRRRGLILSRYLFIASAAYVAEMAKWTADLCQFFGELTLGMVCVDGGGGVFPAAGNCVPFVRPRLIGQAGCRCAIQELNGRDEMNEAGPIFSDAAEFERHLHSLRRERLAAKMRGKEAAVVRKSATVAEKSAVLAKTGGCCHICGGTLGEKWAMAHVVPHVHGGGHGIDNMLPAHVACNGAKWFYGSEEFQWIIKMGVFFRTQFEELDNPSAWILA